MDTLPKWLVEKIETSFPNQPELLKFSSWLLNELERLDLSDDLLMHNQTTHSHEMIDGPLFFIDFERKYWEGIAKMCEGNITYAARMSGVTRSTVHTKISEYDLLEEIMSMRLEKAKARREKRHGKP